MTTWPYRDGPGQREERRLLDLRTYLASGAIPLDVAEGAELEWHLNQLVGSLAVELRKQVCCDQLFVDTKVLPVHGRIHTDTLPRDVLVELPNPWWRRVLGLAPRRVWAPVVGNVAVVDPGDSIDVVGEVEVRVEHFRTFPEARLQYPPWMGDHYSVTAVTLPDGQARFDPNDPVAPS